MQAESSAAGRKRAGRVVLSDSEGDRESAASSPRKQNGSARKKRKSTREPEPVSEDESMSGDESEEEPATQPRVDVGYKPEYQRDPKDQFVSGSIVRIKLINFITYDHVEFYPGPHLNMIMGPNGTGKSTIAAGIAIGLGFHPKVMGRVNDLKSFVKQGTEEARTEIELKGRPGKPNPVIWRSFTAVADKSEWRLNGLATTRKAVQELVASFDVQSNNLCSFLPQDKVAEFAKMAPEVVFRETMRAAGDPRLTKWHDSLKDKGEKRTKLEMSLDANQAEKEKLSTQVNRLRPDVERLGEVQKLENQRDLLGVERLIAEFNKTRGEHSAGIKEKKVLSKKKSAIEARRKPLLELAQKWENKVSKAKAVGVKTGNDVKAHTGEYRGVNRALDHSVEKLKSYDTKIQALEKQAKQRAAQRQNALKKIADCERILNEPMEENAAEGQGLRDERPKLIETSNKAAAAYEAARAKVDSFHHETMRINRDLEATAKRRDRIGSVESQRELEARSFNPSLSFMLDWLKKNQATLEGEVGLPPMMSVNVPDKRYAWQVEMCTNLAQRSTFVCTEKRDYDRLLAFQGKIVNDIDIPNLRDGGLKRLANLKVALHLAYVPLTEANLNPPRPHDVDRLEGYGLECYAIDKVEASKPVIAFLNMKANLSRIALTQRPSANVDIDRINKELGIRTVLTADSHYNSTRSAYGRRDFASVTRPKENPKAFATTVNTAELARIDAEFKKLKLEKQEREGPAHEAKGDMDAAAKKRDAARKKLEENDAATRAWQEHARRHTKARNELENAQQTLTELDSRPSIDAERDELKAKKYDLLKGDLGRLRDLWEHNAAALDLGDASITSAINLVVAQQNYDAIGDYQSSRADAFQEASKALDEMTQRLDDLKRRCADLLEEVKAKSAGHGEEFVAQVNLRKGTTKTPEQVDGEIAEVTAQLELAANVDPTVIERYNRLSKDLEAVTEKVTENREDLQTIRAQINKILSQFNPALDRLVQVVSEKFSNAFARLNCSGEVRMSRSEDFSHWGIEIMVSYRDEQGLELLTGSRQSGGERSLATITYLMSLSEMARTPFSLVDEINQGMDNRAERNVFNQLVETTCKDTAGQYFLITPKLLVGLKYHEKMKVLFVENGGGLPAPGPVVKGGGGKRLRWGDFSGCLQAVKRARSSGVGVSAH